MPFFFPVSCVIPVFNERNTIGELIESLKRQTVFPSEVIIVDGGSTDDTVQVLRQQIVNDDRFHIIEAGRAMPGRARNIGAEKASCEWIAFTDAGIKLDKYWLENLVKKTEEDPKASIVYGNFAPQINSFFDKCAAITYVPGNKHNIIRGKSIVSCLLKKEVWEKVGGFPDWRAAEDLVFMEKAEAAGYLVAEAPAAMAWWELRPTLGSTFKKFELYSKYNVWAGRQAYWHYGVAKQYTIIVFFILLGIFHSWYWLLIIPLWLTARVAKRIVLHKFEFGIKTLFNPAVFFTVMLITLVIDAATFTGWVNAVFSKPSKAKTEF
jgi:glycosyltransferase involved in cell wall biosynthesis